MGKTITTYKCTNCGQTLSKNFVSCPNCKEIGTILKQEQNTGDSTVGAGYKTGAPIAPASPALTLQQIESLGTKRWQTGMSELDRTLGGGLVQAEVVLLGGVAGAGKSTLAITIANNLSKQYDHKTLYVSAEESPEQIKIRADRIGIKDEKQNIRVIAEHNLEKILGHIQETNPDLIIVDSLQRIASNQIESQAGSISQSQEAAHILTQTAKQQNRTAILVSQLNKDTEFSGSTKIVHAVDAALLLERNENSALITCRTTKNRFGTTEEIGLFQHTHKGLQEIQDPTNINENNNKPTIGTAIGYTNEGTRAIGIEIQALTLPTNQNHPKRQFSNLDYNRTQIVAAILEKYCGTPLSTRDLFASTMNGIATKDPQIDLALAAAIISTTTETPLPAKTVYIGELALTGEIRGNYYAETKINTAKRTGFDRFIAPKNIKKHLPENITKTTKIDYIEHVTELDRAIKQYAHTKQ